MSDEVRPGSDDAADDGVELLARATECFESGDLHQARKLARDGRGKVSDPEAQAEADELMGKLALHWVPLAAAAALLVIVLVVAAVAAS